MLNGNVSVFLSQTLLLVAKGDELLLGMDITKRDGDEGEDMVYRTNMGQVNNGEGGEVRAMDIQRLDA